MLSLTLFMLLEILYPLIIAEPEVGEYIPVKIDIVVVLPVAHMIYN